jgi:cobalt-precorrin 5A hydrolase/precorrin-3B C17-methyltransferase
VKRVLTISVSEPGRRLAERLPYEHVHGDPARHLADRWHDVEAFVVVLALGATVRLVAPLLRDKSTDPAVVCVDDAGTFAISVVGGHAGGANALAAEVARVLGAQPVVTTATDATGLPALDQLPGLVAEGDLAGVTAALLADRPVELDNELAWPLPAPLVDRLGASEPAQARIVVTDRATPAPQEGVVLLRPGSLVVGIGTTSDATEREAIEAVRRALERARLSPLALRAVATIDRRRHHRAVEGVAAAFGLDIVTFGPDDLDAIAVPNPSTVVASAVGTRSVAEASALRAAGGGATLVVPKTTTERTTVAVARRRCRAGSLHIVGLGPGSAGHRTPEAVTAVRHAEVVVGLDSYVDQCADLLSPAQEVHRLPLGAELERARLALELAAQGARVALVCSGDAGVYAMASPVLDLLDSPDRSDLEVTVVPGVTAGLASAALLGAPLGHDFLTISLSDLLTPWEIIEARLEAAARTDLVVVVYNPRSRTRTWQLERARSLLLEHRPETTPVGLVTDADRPGQRVLVTTLGQLDCATANMTTCLIIGSSQTRVRAGRMVTPRGYRT